MIGQFIEDFPSTRRGMWVTGKHYITGKKSRNTRAPLVRKKVKGGGEGKGRQEMRRERNSLNPKQNNSKEVEPGEKWESL